MEKDINLALRHLKSVCHTHEHVDAWLSTLPLTVQQSIPHGANVRLRIFEALQAMQRHGFQDAITAAATWQPPAEVEPIRLILARIEEKVDRLLSERGV